jgi:hypothetical protein
MSQPPGDPRRRDDIPPAYREPGGATGRREESYQINMASSINTHVLLLTCIRTSVLSRIGRPPAPAIRPINTLRMSGNEVPCKAAQ